MAVRSESTDVIANDLFWWRRTTDGWRTLVTVYWPDLGAGDLARFECRLFDERGDEATNWTVDVPPGGFLSVDSGASNWNGSAVESGVLSVSVTAGRARSAKPSERRRLYGTIDWYHPTDGMASLHSDHCVLESPATTELTEIALRPAEQRHPYLVFMTADDPAPSGSLSLELANAAGERRQATITEEWASHRVQRVDLGAVFGDLEAFAGGGEVYLAGQRTGVTLFERPYVVSDSPTFSAYHGGDRYRFPPLAGPEHFLLGEGEVNPMLAMVDDDLSTDVTFFNTHGDLEEDFWIGVRLYDTSGALVAHEPRWRQARRTAPTTGSLAELVPSACRPFVGHAAFTFSESGRAQYPRRLQALMAYDGGSTCARIMAWSDEWNTPKRRYRLLQRSGHYLSYFRATCQPFLETWLGITNAGAADLTEPASYRVVVRNERGDEVAAERTVGPLATEWARLPELVDGTAGLLARSESAIVLIESEFDLAMVCFTHHLDAGTWSAEHFMSAPVVTPAGEVWPAGC
jgi:hypothetical protein